MFDIKLKRFIEFDSNGIPVRQGASYPCTGFIKKEFSRVGILPEVRGYYDEDDDAYEEEEHISQYTDHILAADLASNCMCGAVTFEDGWFVGKPLTDGLVRVQHGMLEVMAPYRLCASLDRAAYSTAYDVAKYVVQYGYEPGPWSSEYSHTCTSLGALGYAVLAHFKVKVQASVDDEITHDMGYVGEVNHHALLAAYDDDEAAVRTALGCMARHILHGDTLDSVPAPKKTEVQVQYKYKHDWRYNHIQPIEADIK